MERYFINFGIVDHVRDGDGKGCMTEMRVTSFRILSCGTLSSRKRPDAHQIQAPGYQQNDNQSSLPHMRYQSADGYAQVQHSGPQGVMVYPQGNGQKGNCANYLNSPYGNARSTNIASARHCWKQGRSGSDRTRMYLMIIPPNALGVCRLEISTGACTHA
jgi:hypothetical protein